MLALDVDDFSLYKIPRKIQKELDLLNSDIGDMLTHGYLCLDSDTRMEDLADGLKRLNERWIECIEKNHPSEQLIENSTKRLQECAEVLDRLRKLYLDPPIIFHPKKFIFPEKKEQGPLFTSEAEKELKIKESKEKLAQLDPLRQHWIEQAPQLSMCLCRTERSRVGDENVFLHSLIESYPPTPSFELCVMSIGSGRLLQDWLLLCKLASIGYCNIQLYLADPDITEENVEALETLILKNLPLKASITSIKAYLEPDEIEDKHPFFHAIHALDFDSILFYPNSRAAWKCLNAASQCLQEKGILFCSAMNCNYWFHREQGTWQLPSRENLDPSKLEAEEKSIVFAVTDITYFWQNTLYYLSKLASLNRTIEVKVLDNGDKDRVDLLKISSLAKEILFPQSRFDFTMEYIDEGEDIVYDVFFATNQVVRERFLEQQLKKMRKKGVVVLDLYTCYQRENSNIFKKDALVRQVNATKNAVEACARKFAIFKDLDLTFAREDFAMTSHCL